MLSKCCQNFDQSLDIFPPPCYNVTEVINLLYNFQYFLDMNGEYGDTVEFEYEISDEQNEAIEAAKEEGAEHLYEVDGLDDLLASITQEIEELERECLRDNEEWTEEMEEEYETDDPFEVFSVTVLL